MSAERNLGREYAIALQRYEVLLDHYDISQRTREAVWKTLLELAVPAIIAEVKQYWEGTFGPNGSRETNGNGLTPAGQVIYDARCRASRRRRERAIANG